MMLLNQTVAIVHGIIDGSPWAWELASHQTLETRREIMSMLVGSLGDQAVIASRLGVSNATVTRVVQGIGGNGARTKKVIAYLMQHGIPYFRIYPEALRRPGM